MSAYIHKSHNVSKLMYHFVLPAKYRRVVIDEYVDQVHFLIQSVPNDSPTKIVGVVKSITAKEVFSRCPEVKKKLWGGEFWSDGFYVATVGERGNEKVISNYVKKQGNEYKKLYQEAEIEGQLSFIDVM